MCRSAASAAALGMASLAVPSGEGLARAACSMTEADAAWKPCAGERVCCNHAGVRRPACMVVHCLAGLLQGLMCMHYMQCRACLNLQADCRWNTPMDDEQAAAAEHTAQWGQGEAPAQPSRKRAGPDDEDELDEDVKRRLTALTGGKAAVSLD